MLLKKAILENYGLYKGVNEFELTPRVKYGSTRPIILFGGKNGAGKTTLLDALRLCFYGRTSVGTRVSQKEYHQYLKSKIHRAKKNVIAIKNSKVGVEFNYIRRGEKHTIYVERSWELVGENSVQETLYIFENGVQLQDVTAEFWQGFISEIIPERLSQLFFFDGEKIKSIAEDNTSNVALAEAIKNLLGLDIVDRLKADLSTYISRECKQHMSGDDKKVLDHYAKDVSKINSEIERLNSLRAELHTKRDSIVSSINKIEDRLQQEGYSFASQRKNLLEEKSLIESKISELEKSIRIEVEGAFPLSLCPKVNAKLEKLIIEESDILKASVIRHEIDNITKEILSVFRLKKIKLDESTANLLEAEVVKRFDKKYSTQSKHPSCVLQLSESEIPKVSTVLSQDVPMSRNAIKLFCENLENLTDYLQKIELKINKAPHKDQIAPIVEKLNAENKKLGAIEQELSQCESDLLAFEKDLCSTERAVQKIEAKIIDNERFSSRIDLAKRTKDSLDSYLSLLTERKIDQLRITVAECFNRLSRKGDVLNRIEIDSNSFAVTLFDQHDCQIPKEELSAGEKQIFSIAFLWGLAKTSGRPLPVIIDTPLGRLDSDHRKNLVQNYFPYASHQVLIFSTDTEVDQPLFDELRKNTSHCYHLEYSKHDKTTTPVEGYFWKEPVNA